MQNHYQFAGVELTLEIPDDQDYRDRETLAAFRTERVSHPHVFRIEVAEKIPEPEGKCVLNHPKMLVFEKEGKQLRYIGDVGNGWQQAYAQVENCGRQHVVTLLKEHSACGIKSKPILNALGSEHLVLEAGGCVLHASYIEWMGKAILFTAPSGTGKSTQANLWQQLRNATIINGDRAVIRMEAGSPVACGLPYAGSSGICRNRTLPLAAIVYLSQAPESTINRLKGIRAFRRIWEGCSVNAWDKQDLSVASEIVSEIIKRVPVFTLACTPDESAVNALEKELRKQEGI